MYVIQIIIQNDIITIIYFHNFCHAVYVPATSIGVMIQIYYHHHGMYHHLIDIPCLLFWRCPVQTMNINQFSFFNIYLYVTFYIINNNIKSQILKYIDVEISGPQVSEHVDPSIGK